MPVKKRVVLFFTFEPRLSLSWVRPEGWTSLVASPTLPFCAPVSCSCARDACVRCVSIHSSSADATPSIYSDAIVNFARSSHVPGYAKRPTIASLAHSPLHSPLTHSNTSHLTMSGITLVNQVKASKFLSGVLQPVANAFVNAAGYRKLGAFFLLLLPHYLATSGSFLQKKPQTSATFFVSTTPFF